MSNELNLTLPERKRPASAVTKWIVVLLLCVLAVGVANIAVTILGRNGKAPVPANGTLSKTAQQDLALKLEKQGLEVQAAAAWQEYLDIPGLGDAERAKVWYRIGKIYQEMGDPAQALDSFYRSESFRKDDEIASEIGRRTEECLEQLGKYAALRYELAERVSADDSGATAGEKVVAEIGAQKITQADLDRRIETEVDRQLEQFAAFMPDEQRNAQKERMLKQLTSAEGRMHMLNQLVAEEILYRRARESKLTDDAAVRDLLQDMERKLLAQKVVEQELGSKINITPSDVDTYYQAHQAEYVQPERAHISHILVETEDEVSKVLERLNAGEAFDTLAQELSQDTATKEAGGAVEVWITKDAPIAALPGAKDAADLIFSTEAGTVIQQPIASDKGFHVVLVREREAERQRSIEEVRQQVYQALRSQKEGEVQEKLLNELRDTYDVVIHQSALVKDEPKDAAENGDAK